MTNNKKNKKVKKISSGFPIWAGYLMVAIICVGSTLLLVSNKIEPKTASVTADTLPMAAGDSEQAEGGSETDGSGIGVGENVTGKNAAGINAIGKNATGKYTFVDNWLMDTRVKFALDGIWHRMGNVNEILDTTSRIRHTSELSWYREWHKTAERIRLLGDDCLEKGHRISAGEAYLRASNYYLTAEVMLHTNPDDERIVETYKKGGDYFIKGLELLSAPVSEVWIPYEGTSIKGYFFRADTAAAPDGKAPVLLVHQGYDAPIENTKFIAEEAIRRGYHCLLFEGPGQGLTLREQNIALRPDWEKAVSSVVDYAVTTPGVDEDNIMLMGISMGGGFAVRAAVYESRLKLCILNPGYLNVYGIISNYLTTELMNLHEEDPNALNEKMEEIAGYDVGIRWGMYHGMWVFGAETPSEFLDNVKKFDNTGIIEEIRCKVLVMDGTSEEWGKGQAKELYDMLKCEKDYMLFTEEDSASEHCQVGAGGIATQRLFDWIDENM